MTQVVTSGDGFQLLRQQQCIPGNENCDCREVLCQTTQQHQTVQSRNMNRAHQQHVSSEENNHIVQKLGESSESDSLVTRPFSAAECGNDRNALQVNGGTSTGWRVSTSLRNTMPPFSWISTGVVPVGEVLKAAVPHGEPPLVIHSVGVRDFLIGDIFICPQTLELVCIQKMFNCEFEFSWESYPSPAIISEQIARPKGIFGAVMAAIRPATRLALPAALDPSSGELHCGKSLLKTVRSRVIVRRRAKSELSAVADLHGSNNNFLLLYSERDGAHSLNNSCCNGIGRATRLALTEMVERTFQAALNYYLWVDDAMFWNFTLPLHQHTFGYLYGTYYSMRRRVCVSRITQPADPNSPYLNSGELESGTNGITEHCRDSVSVKETMIIKGLQEVLQTLETLLGGRSFLGGDEADLLDACVFSHLAIIFSLPLPDRPRLQKAISSHVGLMEYCKRFHLKFSPWPQSPSFLFGCRSLSSAATEGAALTVHSWRQRSVEQGSLESQGSVASEKILWSIAALACTTVVALSVTKPWLTSVTDVETGEQTDEGEGFVDEGLLEDGRDQ